MAPQCFSTGRDWHCWALRRPAVATPRVIGRLLAFLYAACGTIGLIAYYLADRSGDRPTARLLVIYVVCVLVVPLLLRIRGNRPWGVLAATAAGTALVTAVVHLMGNTTMAVAAAILYLLMIIPCFYLYSRPIAVLHGGLIGAVALYALPANPAVDPAELTIGAGAVATLTLAISWLVRAADLAEVDYLTGLPNRRGFDQAAAFVVADDRRVPLALVEIDLDGFGTHNGPDGSPQADDLLYSLARRWKRLLPHDAVLARHGGHEFSLLMWSPTSDAVDHVLAAMRACVEQVTFSAGIAWAARPPTGPGEPLAMLKLRADAAMYAAKLRGPGQTVVAAAPQSVRSGQAIVDALAAGEFVLHYQPIVDLGTGAVDKAEALVRWQHPHDGLVSPGDFVPVAEQSGVMVELGDWVIATACHDAAAWAPNSDGRPIAVSINASGVELQDPTYARRVLGHAQQAGLTTDRIVIELVESDYNVNSAVVRANLTALTVAGVSLAIDDFGTGYSNLSRLDRIEVKVLKVDRCFTRAVTEPGPQVPVLAAILAMSQTLRLQVVAEGVETPEQAAWLRSHGCSHAQGYLFGRPAPHSPALTARPLTPL